MTNEPYLEITLPVSQADQDLAVAMLSTLGFDGFEQRPDVLIAFIPERSAGENIPESIEEELAAVGIRLTGMSRRRIEPQNWNATWEAGIQPFRVGDFFIKPDWREEQPEPGEILLIITPKMAFGTGNHETTRLILRHLPGLVVQNRSVIDVGMGTGILSIAAVKSGASLAFGFDIDEWSVLNANENAVLNHVEEAVRFVKGSFDTLGPVEQAETVFANLQRHIIIEFQTQLANSVLPGGKLVLSGILIHEVDEIRRLPAFSALQELLRDTDGEWAMLVLEK